MTKYFLIPFESVDTFCTISGAKEVCRVMMNGKAETGLIHHRDQEVIIEFTRSHKSAQRDIYSTNGLPMYRIRMNELLVCCENDTQTTMAYLENGFEVSETLANEIVYSYNQIARARPSWI